MSNTRRTTSARTAENKANGKPVSLDLDVFQAEARRDPFTVRLGGKVFTMPHMADLDWHVGEAPDGTMTANASVHDLLKTALGGQWDAFTKLKLSTAGYNKLFQAWSEHSGIEPGEDGASPSSSASTAGQ